MSNNNHQWKKFASPRNGQIQIQACEVCGIVKGMANKSYKCSKEKKNLRLKGWIEIDNARNKK